MKHLLPRESLCFTLPQESMVDLSTDGSGAKLGKNYIISPWNYQGGKFPVCDWMLPQTGLWMVQKHKLYFRKGAVLWKSWTGVDRIIMQVEYWSQCGSQFHSNFLCHSGIVERWQHKALDLASSEFSIVWEEGGKSVQVPTLHLIVWLWAECLTSLELLLHQYCVGVVVQSLSCVRLFVTPWPAASQTSLSFTSSRSLLKLRSIESMMPSNHLILCHPLLLQPSVFPSIRVFFNESVLRIRWPKY